MTFIIYPDDDIDLIYLRKDPYDVMLEWGLEILDTDVVLYKHGNTTEVIKGAE